MFASRTRRLLATALGALACTAALGTQAPSAQAAQNCGQAQNMRVERWTGNYIVDLTNRYAAEHSLICLVNNWREINRLPPLTRNYTLDTVAYRYSGEMLARNIWDPVNHLDALGRGPYARMQSYWQNRGSHAVAENIYKATGNLHTPVQAWVAWLGSPGHNKNMLDPRMREVGVSIWWGTPKNGPGGSVSQAGATYTMDFGVRQ